MGNSHKNPDLRTITAQLTGTEYVSDEVLNYGEKVCGEVSKHEKGSHRKEF